PLRAMPMPLVLGLEAAGVVEAVGEGVERFRQGDRVAYASAPLGAYRDVRNFPAERCVALPAFLSDRDAATVLLKGLTLQTLLRRVFRVPAGAWVVFHSAAGGVGTLAGQWLRALRARAIGTVGDESKVAAARAAGYEAVFVRGRDDWPARVRELSGGGVPVVYDSVGRDTWQGSLACLAARGHLVCFGNSSGLAPPFQVNELRDRGSLILTWVRFSDYTVDAAELQSAAQELIEAIASGALKPPAAHCLPLGEAAEAHRLLESGRTTGPLVLLP
ncbi:MAG TPA: quinone oxidoreductase, partial [Burkholderiales bacterium]|nr:quinone oxidoreductase [Burkholderiales bacterium]